MTSSQVQAAKADDLGAQAVAKELGGLPVVEDASVPPGSVRVVLAADYTGPGSGLATATATDGGRRRAGDSGRDEHRRSPAVADHHRRLRRPGVRQLT